jgi:cobaltochelatase CobN
MQAEGYAGAGAMREFVEYLWGRDATATQVVDDAMWQETYEPYVEDKQQLGMKQYFEASSPFAYQDITARMIETIRKDHWNADEATRAKLVSEYLESVADHGVNCTDVSCGNGRLMRYVMEEAARAGVPAPLVSQARAAIEKAMGRTIESAATELENFARRNDARADAERAENTRLVSQLPPAVAQQASQPAGTAPAPYGPPRSTAQDAPATAQPPANAPQERAPLAGQLMTEEERAATPSLPVPSPMPILTTASLLWPAALFLLLLLAWRLWDRRQAVAVSSRWEAAQA